ncbi:MAG: ABC transporter permease, partial [Cyanobacteria bacterium J06642_11]
MLGNNLLTTLVTPHLDRLGDRNPQLLRELKGRLKRFPIITAIVLSILCQLVAMVSFWVALPGPVVVDDMVLSTYPRLEWRAETQLSPKAMQDLLPADMVNRDRATQSGIVVSQVELREPVKGDKSLGEPAAKLVQSGDRLIRVNGQLIVPSSEQMEDLSWQHRISELVQTVNDQIAADPYGKLTPKRQKLIDTTVDVELYNAEQGYYTVTLPRVAVTRKNNSYCFVDESFYGRTCALTPDKQAYQLDWRKWYRHIYTCLSVLIVFPLLGGGVFMLANNLAVEKRRGTLNFLQLSPRSAFTILSGKLLGVPICLYLAIALLCPLHWAVGLNAGHSVAYLVGFDLVLIAQTLIVYLAAFLISLSVSHPMALALQPWLLAAVIVGFNWIMLLYAGSGEFVSNAVSNVLLWSVLFSPFSSLAYFNFEPVTTAANVNIVLGNFRVNFAEYVILATVHAMGWCALLGHGLERRFSNSAITLLRRRFSYPLTLVFAVIMLGLTGT